MPIPWDEESQSQPIKSGEINSEIETWGERAISVDVWVQVIVILVAIAICLGLSLCSQTPSIFRP